MPTLPRIVGAIQTAAGRLDGRIHSTRIARGDRNTDPSKSFCEAGKSIRQRLPLLSAIGRFEQAAACSREHTVLPRTLPRLPQDGVDVIRVGGIEREIDTPGVRILIKDLLEGAAAVGRSEDP